MDQVSQHVLHDPFHNEGAIPHLPPDVGSVVSLDWPDQFLLLELDVPLPEDDAVEYLDR